MCGGGAARYKRLEHAPHHHRLHVLGQGLVVARCEVVTEARLVWKQQGGRRDPDHTGSGLAIGMGKWWRGGSLNIKQLAHTTGEIGRGKGKGFVKRMGGEPTQKGSGIQVGNTEYMQGTKACLKKKQKTNKTYKREFVGPLT